MVPPRRYDTAAQRQAAYLQRQAAAREALLLAKGLPPLPALATMPGDRRWGILIQNAARGLEIAAEEMEAYFDERTARWREGEKGEEFVARLEELKSILTDLARL